MTRARVAFGLPSQPIGSARRSSTGAFFPSAPGPGRRFPRLAALVGCGVTLCFTGCGYFTGSDGIGNSSGFISGKPEVRILAPRNGQAITGSIVRVELLVRGVRLVNKIGQPNVPGEGHLRVWVDTEDLSAPPIIQTASTFDLTGLASGLHHLIVELRQNDGSPLPGTPTDVERDTRVHKHVHFDTVSALARIQDEIFTPKCATAGCHIWGGAAPMPLTDARTSREVLVDVLAANGAARAANKKRVAPGQPDQSFLLHKVTRELQFGQGDPMPPASPLTAAQIDLIRLWIAQGAVPAP